MGSVSTGLSTTLKTVLSSTAGGKASVFLGTPERGAIGETLTHVKFLNTFSMRAGIGRERGFVVCGYFSMLRSSRFGRCVRAKLVRGRHFPRYARGTRRGVVRDVCRIFTGTMDRNKYRGMCDYNRYRRLSGHPVLSVAVAGLKESVRRGMGGFLYGEKGDPLSTRSALG